MSSSRLRDQAPTIFDTFCEIVSVNSGDKPTIVWKYPEDFNDERILKAIVEFAFPTTLMDGDAVQLFTFVFTDLEGRYSFGYCRHTPAKRSCFCVLSALPWTDVFYRLLNHVAGLTKRSPGRLTTEAESLLERAYHTDIPGPGDRLTLDSGLGSGNKVEFVCPDDRLLPRIPDNRNLTEYYNAVREENMLAIFASLLCERRIILTSSKLGKLSACVLAASGLLYPMHWQHIFIPVLPDHLVHILHAPMPYLIGVPSSIFSKVRQERIDLSEVVVLNIDTEEFISPFEDFAELPNEVVQVLKKNLRSSNHLLGDGVARSFLRALVVLLGGYREALRFRQGETITFSEEGFVQSRQASMRKYLEKMLHLQIFHQFIEDRLVKLNVGEDPRDEFEEECCLYSAKEYNRFKTQYDEWIGNMRKEGGAFFKKMKKEGLSAVSNIGERFSKIKEGSLTSAGPARRTPSPAPKFLDRVGSVVIGGRQSPRNQQKRKAKSKSVILKGETDALKNSDEDDTASKDQESIGSGSFFGVGGLDLLSELQHLMQGPNSFIEKLEQQQLQRSRRSPIPLSSSNGDKSQDQLVNLTNGDTIRPPAPPSPAQEALLIDFGPEKVNVAELEIADFDPLVSKSISAPTSPKKQFVKANQSTTFNDLRAAAVGTPTLSYSSSGRHWEKFE